MITNKKKIRITMPENATPKQIEKFTKDWKFIINALEDLTGEKGSTTMYMKDEAGKKKILYKTKK